MPELAQKCIVSWEKFCHKDLIFSGHPHRINEHHTLLLVVRKSLYLNLYRNVLPAGKVLS